ncbi:hypothetical protein [Pedobacter sp. SYP-B3415]|uniref:hypothetical protein n=1 Tax=Pedobacter sp. SYP-B3415 TaxID=2496641 RepID=UPI00101C266A|nr:hypothetical protein [Pedobacter sp. SYP-B3415]
MKTPVFFVLLLVMFGLACTRSVKISSESATAADTAQAGMPSPADVPEHRLVVPGAAVGHLAIGADMQAVLQKLGKPNAGDAAMGSAWSVWYHPDSTTSVNDDELGIFSAYADSGMVRKEIRQIRVTSPDFRTDLGIGVGSSSAELRKLYPAAKPAGRLLNKRLKDTLSVYDDAQQGIAFDVIRQRITGLSVHKKGVAFQQGYLTLNKEWQPLP